ncbi:MAG: hypothetical protein LQ337_007668 [Flavoplaca oasis]|nr:MAG: hypothetical protein LQ337_007668 [Flavoplaca oasis]
MSDRRRRKSLSIFRPPLAPLTPINDDPPDTAPATLRKRRPTSISQAESPASSPTDPPISRTNSKHGLDRLVSMKRGNRPSSLFGSLRSLSSLHDENEELTKSASSPSSLNSFSPAIPDVAAGMVIQHGPLPEVGPMFRRRCPYLVLTDNHLIQFKSQDRASEMFPCVARSGGHSAPGSGGQARTSIVRHSRLSSSSSVHELQSSLDGLHSIPLLHVVAVHKLDDGEPYFSIEIAYFNDDTNHASTLTLQIHDPRESDAWLTTIRSTASSARSSTSVPFPQSLVEHTARALEQEQDYDPQHFHMFKVVQRANKSGKRSSSDDLTKLTSKICILAIGLCKVHLVPLPKATRTSSSTSLSDMNGISHGIVTLASVKVMTFDDSFQLCFRRPCQSSSTLHLAALCVHEVVIWLRQAAEFLRPEWTEQPFAWVVPQSLNDELLPIPSEEEENRGFDRTLIAYCSAYGINTSTIRYRVNYSCEDAPAFELLPITGAGRLKYNATELLAILRALRYNESFVTISLSQTALDSLHCLYDEYGWEHTPWTSRSGQTIELENQQKASLLIQEVRALAVTNKRLRRLDFSDCLIRRPSSAGAISDVGCGICEALFPLCAKQYTNVDWIILNGIMLSDADVDYLYAAAISKDSHFRAIEVSNCSLADRTFLAILQALSHQGSTLECLNFSSNIARLEPLHMCEYLDELGYIRKVDFSNTYRTSGQEPLLGLRTLVGWKLEELDLSRSSINAASLQAIAGYLRSPQSQVLRHLRLNQCGLTGGNVADLLEAMADYTPCRDLHLYINENHLEQGHDRLAQAISQSLTPLYMTMQMLEYKEEKNFRLLVQAWTQNISTRYLDMSKVSLPSEAANETIAAMQSMLAENQILESLNIAGEQAHLEVANFGSGISKALTGLQRNKSIKMLHVEHQKLGMPGANALASILEENNTLEYLYCAGNGFTLQAFTVIVRSLATNHTLVFLANMEEDRVAAIKAVDREIDSVRESGGRGLTMPSKATVNNVKRTIGSAVSGQLPFSSRGSNSPQTQRKQHNDRELAGMMDTISENWRREMAVMQTYLKRNQHLAKKRLVAMGDDQASTTSSVYDSNEVTPMGEPDRQLTLMSKNDEDNEGHDEGDEGMDEALMMTRKLAFE